MRDNKQTFKTGSLTVTASGTAEQLDDYRVPQGHCVTVLAKESDAGGYVYVGESKAQAEAHHIELAPGKRICLYVDNVHDIWIDCSAQANNTVGWIVEAGNADA